MAQGGVSGILDYTAGGNVFGILSGGIRTENGHEEESDVFTRRRTYYDVDVVFEQKFKNVPTVTISNLSVVELESTTYYNQYTIAIDKSGFVLSFIFESSGNNFDYSFDWTATGK